MDRNTTTYWYYDKTKHGVEPPKKNQHSTLTITVLGERATLFFMHEEAFSTHIKKEEIDLFFGAGATLCVKISKVRVV